MTWRTYIDGNSVGHAASHGTKKQTKLFAGEQETTAIYGLLRSMNVILRERTAAAPVVLWDGRSWRHTAFDEYKGTRDKTPEQQKDRAAYKSQMKSMVLGLHLLGVRQVISGNMEADDLAAILTRDAVKKGDTVALITGDQDWIQLVQPGVVWVDHKTTPPRKVNTVNFKSFTGYDTPEAFIHGKALVGDTGDNVKPRTGIGKDLAPLLLSTFGTVHKFIETPLDEAEDRYFLQHGKKMSSGMRKFHGCKDTQGRFEWARGLMDLSHPDIPKPQSIRLTHARLNRPAFEKFCGEHAFHSLLSGMERFISPFVTLDKEFPN